MKKFISYVLFRRVGALDNNALDTKDPTYLLGGAFFVDAEILTQKAAHKTQITVVDWHNYKRNPLTSLMRDKMMLQLLLSTPGKGSMTV